MKNRVATASKMNCKQRLGAEPAEGALQFGSRVFRVTAAMREDDAFRLPGEQLLQACAGGGTVGEGGTHINRRLAGRVVVASQFHHQLPKAAHFCGFDVFNQVGEDEGTACHMEEVDFTHDAAAAKFGLRNLPCPGGRGGVAKVGVKPHIDAVFRGAHAGACPGGYLRVARLPGGDVGVMDVVGRDEVAHRAERVHRGKKRVVRRNRRMALEAAVGEADDGHPRGKRRAQDTHVHPGEVAVGNPDIFGDGFQGIERLVERDGDGYMRSSGRGMPS